VLLKDLRPFHYKTKDNRLDFGN